MEGICVLVAARNVERTVARAVASALAESEVREVVVIDDASRDGTARAACSADDGTGRLRVFRNPRNLGPAAARNRGLAVSTAPLIAVLDADDIILPGRFAKLADPGRDWDVSADNIMFVPAEQAGDFARLRAFSPGGIARKLTFERFVAGNIRQPGKPRAELGFLKPVMRRAFLERHGLAYDEQLRLGEDYDLYARMLLAGARFRLVAACGYVALERPDSLSETHSAADLEALVAADEWILESVKGTAAREVLEAHRAQCAERAHHRRFLDAKRESGLARALYRYRRCPQLLIDAARAVLRNKLALARRVWASPHFALGRQPRFLVQP